MKFTIETLRATEKTGFMRREPTDEIAGYRIWRDDGMCMETYDPADQRLAESRCEELNRIFGSVTLNQYHDKLAEHGGQG